ncbi:Hsp70 family protein [Candidatus Venteria ishoeyi]|uniref:Chaperone protein DnaK n=1 Tax=Candidatus Venteria ishoeyi TaxID=1899563 RepID=A0A1H6F990_9GAMM|nr:Hsp70 family protein [Candidatus Venteria ishoeyi]SEH06173.1 Chaperone protein DnaK [Candidatus Venteria ishoeyi]
MSEIIIGIDLGTTNSEVAVVENGKVTIIEDQGDKMLPSFVGISDNNELLVGESAKNQYILYPERSIKSIKRKMGEDSKINMAGQDYSPQEISAIILKRLKAIAEAYLKQSVSKAVITVPAYFSDTQRQATREAGEIAGLEVMRIINEPTAAALSYETAHKAHKKILVYDLGGGTFDVSVVGVEDDVVEVLASHGNNQLGGDDFDAKIIEHILQHLDEKYPGLDVSQSRKAIARIGRAAELAKCNLSDNPFAAIQEEYLEEHDGAPVHLSLELSRNDYEVMIDDYVEETLEAVHTALTGAKLTVSDIDEILLVGGSTRTPLIGERLQEKFKLQPHAEIDPDLCVAAGAAIQGAMIAGSDVSAVLVDITPYTYGTSALGNLGGMMYEHKYIPIIHKNTPLPVSKSEVFYTLYDGQKVVEVDVYQGEATDALDNIEIGMFNIEGLSDVPEGNEIMVKLDLDLDGVLNVKAWEKCTGLEKSIVIENAIARFAGAELETARQRIEHIFDTKEQTADDGFIEAHSQTEASEITRQHQAVIQAEALVEKTQRMLDQASNDDREDMQRLMGILKQAIADNDITGLQEPEAELADILYYLES